eukprot:188871-Chlamydomonas_euryale.AAC.1
MKGPGGREGGTSSERIAGVRREGVTPSARLAPVSGEVCRAVRTRRCEGPAATRRRGDAGGPPSQGASAVRALGRGTTQPMAAAVTHSPSARTRLRVRLRVSPDV